MYQKLCLAILGVAWLSQLSHAQEYIGGTTVAANHAEGCCRAVSGNALFDFNGGVGDITDPLLVPDATARQTLDGLDERSGADGIWNPGGTGNVEGDGSLLSGAGQAVFTVDPPADYDLITGFQVMNATNATFDERQSDYVEFEVSYDDGATWETILETPLDVIDASASGDQAPPEAQEFMLDEALVAADVDYIRITAFDDVTGAITWNNVAPSLAELRIIVDTAPQAVPEPASILTFAMMLLVSAGAAVVRFRKRR